MYKPVLLPLAKQDIKDAALWYNSQQRGLGKRFIHVARRKVNYICRNPKSISIRYGNTRCALLEKFPFMLHFTLDDIRKEVIITAVFHTSQNPDSWKNR